MARLAAIALDGIIGMCAMGITLMLCAQKGLPQIQTILADEPGSPELTLPVMAAGLVGVSLPFLFAIQVSRRGATPGKAMMSLTVRNLEDGSFPPYPRALSREVLRFLHLMPGLMLGDPLILGGAMILVVFLDMSRNALSRTWYDRVTRTIIVAPEKERE